MPGPDIVPREPPIDFTKDVGLLDLPALAENDLLQAKRSVGLLAKKLEIRLGKDNPAILRFRVSASKAVNAALRVSHSPAAQTNGVPPLSTRFKLFAAALLEEQIDDLYWECKTHHLKN